MDSCVADIQTTTYITGAKSAAKYTKSTDSSDSEKGYKYK